LPRYIYGEGPASQNDFHGIVIHELPEPELDNQTPPPKLKDIYARKSCWLTSIRRPWN